MAISIELAVKAIRSGRRVEGRKLLNLLIQQNPNDELAWIWMSELVDTDQQRAKCLYHALAINPNSEIANFGLQHLGLAKGVSAPALPVPQANGHHSAHALQSTAADLTDFQNLSGLEPEPQNQNLPDPVVASAPTIAFTPLKELSARVDATIAASETEAKADETAPQSPIQLAETAPSATDSESVAPPISREAEVERGSESEDTHQELAAMIEATAETPEESVVPHAVPRVENEDSRRLRRVVAVLAPEPSREFVPVTDDNEADEADTPSTIDLPLPDFEQALQTVTDHSQNGHQPVNTNGSHPTVVSTPVSKPDSTPFPVLPPFSPEYAIKQSRPVTPLQMPMNGNGHASQPLRPVSTPYPVPFSLQETRPTSPTQLPYLMANGLPMNGHGIHHQPANGLPMNGHGLNGYVNGLNGQPMNGHPYPAGIPVVHHNTTLGMPISSYPMAHSATTLGMPQYQPYIPPQVVPGYARVSEPSAQFEIRPKPSPPPAPKPSPTSVYDEDDYDDEDYDDEEVNVWAIILFGSLTFTALVGAGLLGLIVVFGL